MRPAAGLAGIILLAALLAAATPPGLRAAAGTREFRPPALTRGAGISIELGREYLNPWENLTANVSIPGNLSPTVALITPDNRTVNLSAHLSQANGSWTLSFPLPSISPVPLGNYSLKVEAGALEATANFTVDSLYLSADWSCSSDSCTIGLRVESALTGEPVEANVSLVVVGPDNASTTLPDLSVNGSANVSFDPWAPGNYSLSLRAVDFRGIAGSLGLAVTVPPPQVGLRIDLQREVYAPGEVITAWISANTSLDGVNASLTTPGGGTIRLDPVRVNGSTWLANYTLASAVELGGYVLRATGWGAGALWSAEAQLWVDVLTVELDASPGLAAVNVTAFAAGPVSGANVSLNLTGPENLSASATTEEGLAEFALPDLPPGDYSLSVSANWRGLSAGAEGYLSIPPANATLELWLPEELEFAAGENASVEGRLLLSGAPPGNASVDYSLEAPGGGEVLGGELSAQAPGNFTIPLGQLEPGNYTLEVNATLGNLRAANATTLVVRQPPRACLPEAYIDGVSLSVEGACVSDARFVEPPKGPWRGRGNLTGLLLTLEGEPGFSAEVRLSGVAGILAVTRPGGAPLRVRPGENRTLLLIDGGSADPDGQRDGRVSVTIVAELLGGPKTGVSGKGVPEKAPKKPKKQALVEVLAEFEAKGEDGTWLVRWLDVRRPGYYRLQMGAGHVRVHRRGADFEVSGEELWFDSTGRAIVEALLDGTPAAPPARQALVAPGEILVELVNKSEGEWRRVSVSLPPRAVVEEVLALGNETREVELWYQRGPELVFYDDPNRYYYVLYGVPDWWDPDGPNSGDDWHYRVPITVPPGDQYQMAVAEVNFTDLLADLNVSGTFDNDSVRVVDPSGSLVPRQEYIPTGPGVGIVKFLLPADLAAQETFYVYFDILENGAKPSYNTLNTGVDAGDLSHWLWGKSPSGIASIIEASPRGPYIVDGGTAGNPPPDPPNITDDGTPAVGDYSLVLGYRVNVSEDATASGEDTWAAYEITVPSGGGSLTFWYRVESWDSANYDYLIVTIRDASNNTLDTVLGPYNPNPGNFYGTFADSGWLSTSYDLTPYAGQTIRVNFTVHTFSDDLYKTWAYVDDLTWCNVTAAVQADMVEGFGVNLTEPSGVRTWGPVEVVARVDAAPTGGILARLYDPSGALVASSPLYDDGTHGDAVAGDGVFTNDNVYTISPGDPLGEWRVVVLANDSSASTYSPSYDGLIHIPGRPYEVNYTDFFNVDEVTFEVRANLTGVVYEDVWPLATGFATEDLPISGARVGLFLDDGDGVFDPLTDPLVNVTQTDSAGRYSFLARNDTYWVVVDSKTLTSPRGLNGAHGWNETWAEGTYVVSWDGSAHAGSPDFGGRDPEVSDNCSLEVVFHDGFETWAGWTDYGSGNVSHSNEQAYEGSYSLKKDSNNDPNGGYKLLGQAVGRGVILQGYVYRPSLWSGGAIDRVGIEDSSFNGYTFAVDHNRNRIWIDRRDGGAPTRISQRVSFDPPEDEWYFWKMMFFQNNTIAFQVYDLSGNLLAEVRATDTTYSSFDRVVVHGGYEYYVDELTLWMPGTRCEHVSLVSAGAYLGESLDFGFSFDVVVNALDEDHDPSAPRFAQGTLRQFIANSNAISGPDRSWFVMAVPPNVSPDPSHSWWRVEVNSSLGPLPTISDDGTEINGTVFYPNATVRDSNPGCLLNGGPSPCGATVSVGLGGDGLPGTGDERAVQAFERPEVEVNLSRQGVYGIHVGWGVSDFTLARVAVYGASGTLYGAEAAVFIDGGGSGNRVEDCLIGVRADGSDPGAGGRNLRYGLRVDMNDATVRHNYVGYNGYGILLYSWSGEHNATVEENEVFSNGITAESPDGDGIAVWMNGSAVRYNYAHDNGPSVAGPGADRGSGVELAGGARDNVVEENAIVRNSCHGVRIAEGSRDNVVRRNLIADNGGPGVLLGVEGGVPFNNTVSENSVFNNSGLGIDITSTAWANGDGVTPNDGALDGSQPNNGVDYPVMTTAFYNGTHVYVEGFINDEAAGSGSGVFANARVEVFLVNNSGGGDDLAGNDYGGRRYGEGWVYLGSLTADANGEFSGWIPVSTLPDALRPEVGSLLTGTATLPGNGTSEFGPDAKISPLRLNLSVRKSIASAASPCYYDVTLNVTNWNPTPAPSVRVYDVIPANMVMESASPPPDGSSGGVYWWELNLAPAGTPPSSQIVTYTLMSAACGTADYNLSDALIVGLDPPDGYLNVSASEFVDVVLYPDSTYEVRGAWGFLTVSNPTGDVISDVRVAVDSTGIVFYPDYPTPSDSPAALPLHAPELRPGEYWRWRYEVDPSLVTPPVTAVESVTPSTLTCGERGNMTLRLTLRFTDGLSDVSLLKPIPAWFTPTSARASGGSVSVAGDSITWDLGDVEPGDSFELVVEGTARLTGVGQFPPGSLTFRKDHALLLERIEGIHAVGPAAVGVEKNLSAGGFSVRARFASLAGDLVYNLTEVCVWDGPPPGGRLVFCERPGEAVHPGGSWSSPWRLDPLASGTPEYYAEANFTVVPVVGGVQVPLSEAVRGVYLVRATLLEPNVSCAGAPPAPAELTFSKRAEPGVASVGDAVTFTIRVANVGGSESGVIVLEDALPGELTYVSGSSSVNGTSIEPEVSGSVLRWVLPPLPPGGEWTLSFSAAVSSAPAGGRAVVYNVVLHEGGEVARAPVVIVGPPGPPPTTAAPRPVRPVGLARLSISKECSPGEVSVGDVVSCRIVVGNAGNGSAANLTLVDVLPAGLSYVEGTANPPPHRASPGRLEWVVPDLPPGGTFEAAFHAVVTAEAGESLVNVAYVQNLTATYRISVRARPTPGPVISKVGTYLGNQTIRYTVSVYLRGGLADVTVVDTLPYSAVLVPGSVSTSGVAYSMREPAERGLRVVLRPARVGEPATVTYLVGLPPGLAGDVVNVAELPEYGLVASSVVRVPPTLLTAQMGGASALPILAFLLAFLGFRRVRRLALYDARSTRLAILAGGLGGLSGVGGRALVTRSTAEDLLADPAFGPAAADLIRRGTVEVLELGEGELVQALMLARTTGISMEAASNLIAAVSRGATAAVLSDVLAASVAREIGLDVVLLPLTVVGER